MKILCPFDSLLLNLALGLPYTGSINQINSKPMDLDLSLCQFTLTSIKSRVVPGIGLTMAISRLVKPLSKVLLPTLGRPTIETLIPSLML